jgi:hypothetical protein
MSRLRVSCLALLCTVASAMAGADESGKLEDLLKRAIAASTQGSCPAELMSPLLRSTCENQQPSIGQRLTSLGKVSSLSFMGMQDTPNGPAEVYRVKHERGQTTWMINTDSKGKIVVLWFQ